MRSSWRIICFSYFMLLISDGVKAQQSISDLYAAEEYTQCIEDAKAWLVQYSGDSSAYYFEGMSHLKLGAYAASLRSLDSALAFRYVPAVAVFLAKAKCHAALGKDNLALALLDMLDQRSFANYASLDDRLFATIDSRPDFIAFKKSVYGRAFPCFHDSNYLKLDFWLGEWDVYVGSSKVGENSILKQDGGCMITERYTTNRDYVGQSTNFYDTDDQLWKQIWIDKTRQISKYVEINSGPGLMVFETKPTVANPAHYRMTFAKVNDEQVTQVIETSSDKGETWQMAFDGRYERKL